MFVRVGMREHPSGGGFGLLEALDQRVPRERGALDPHRELHDAAQRFQIAQLHLGLLGDERTGAEILQRALQEPLRQLVANAGLVVTEASQISPQGQGYLDTPGIYSPEQVAAWKKVTDAVHAKDGKIVIQLWHVGRISHVSLQPGGIAPVSSTIRTDRPSRFRKR